MNNSGLLIQKWCEHYLGKGRFEEDDYVIDFSLYIENLEESSINYQVKFKENYTEIKIRPYIKDCGGRSDIKPSQYFSGIFTIVSYKEFLDLVEANKKTVLDYLNKVREKDEGNRTA